MEEQRFAPYLKELAGKYTAAGPLRVTLENGAVRVEHAADACRFYYDFLCRRHRAAPACRFCTGAPSGAMPNCAALWNRGSSAGRLQYAFTTSCQGTNLAAACRTW